MIWVVKKLTLVSYLSELLPLEVEWIPQVSLKTKWYKGLLTWFTFKTSSELG
jgi:hypothetical protein